MDGVAEWSESNVAMLGATAALAGLVIVAAIVVSWIALVEVLR